MNGGIEYNGPIRSLGAIIQHHEIFGNYIYTSGTNHQCKARLSWINIQSTDENAFLISGKMRGILGDSTHVYRRFETWITPLADGTASKPKGLTDFEIASYYTSGISGFNHNVNRVTDTMVELVIDWTTSTTLSSTNKMVIRLELDVSYPETLGKMTIIAV